MPELTCPCCGYLGICDEYDICEYCRWEHAAAAELTTDSGAFSEWLRKAQRRFMEHAAPEPGGETTWRARLSSGVRDPEWLPLDQYRQSDLRLLGAVRAGDVGGVGKALEEGADIESSFRHGYYQGWTSLIWAAAWNGEVTRYLLGRGANPNAAGKHSETALLMAVRGADVDVVERLIRAGAEPNRSDALGTTAFDVLRSESFLAAFRFRHPLVDPEERVARLLEVLSGARGVS
jgi:hypothetical protein